MADPVLKFPGEQKDDATPATAAAAPGGRLAWLRRYRRLLLLVVLPLVVAVAAVGFYLAGGRYVTTDNAYVGAQKVLVTPDISGKIARVVVREGAQLARGDTMFEIDPVPFRLALAQAEAKVAQAATDLANLKTNDAALTRLVALAEKTVDLRQRDVDRKTTLVAGRSGSQFDLDSSVAALVAADNQLEQLRQQQASVRNRLLGETDLPLDKFPPWLEASAARDQAQRDLDHTRVRAPMNGVATQVDNIQIGRFVAAGTPLFSIVDLSHPWIDANPKESDFTYLVPGQPVTVTVDAFPDHVFKATVGSLSPGTGAEFAILPPQNATGNFIKIVQRVPVRIYFDEGDPTLARLKAGMSSYVSIDTGHRRSLARLLGLSRASAEHGTP
jgi:membrane fusion protein (multidrug efflux system)